MLSGIGMIFAQSGQKLSYQAVIRNSANQLVTNTQLEVTIGIANSEDGAAVYTEHHTVTTNANGLISLMIGTGDNRTGDWGQIEWEHAYVTTNTVVDGVPVRHKVELTAVAHAFYADDVDEGAVVEVLNNHGIEDGAEPNVQGDWNQENAGADDYIKNKPTLSNVAISGDYNDLINKPDLNQYATNVHLNDTLGHYLMREVQILSISNDTIYLTGGSFVKLPAGFSGDYNDLINKPLKSALCDSVQECVTGWISDSTRMVFDTLHAHYVNTNTLRDTASAIRNAIPKNVSAFTNDAGYLTSDSAVIVNLNTNVTNLQGDVTNLQGDVTNLQTNVTSLQNADNVLSSRITTDSTNLATNYYDKTQINDTLSHYLMNEVQVLRISNDTIYLTGGSFVKLPAGFSGDYNDLINKPLKSALCDSVHECVTGWISESTRMVFDTLHTKYATTNALRDSLTHYVGIEKLNDTLGHYLQAGALCDSIVKCGVIKDMRDSIRTNAQNIQSNSQRIATNETNITSLQAADNALSERIKADSLNLVGFKTKVRVDSATLVSRIVADSTALHKAIKDTAAAIRADIHDSVLVIKQGDVVLGTFSANQNHNDTINIPTPPDAQVQADWNQNTTTAKDYIKNKPNIRDSVNRVVLDSLYAANSAMNRAVDTISRHNIHDSLVVIRTKIHTDSLVLAGKMRTDSIDLVNRIVTDSTALATRMDTLLNHVCDSVKSCVTGWISDSTRMVFDTLHTKYATTNALRDSLTHYVGIEKLNDTLGHYLQADALCDSIVKCGVIKDMRDSIQKVDARLTMDSTVLAEKIRSDSSTVHGALVDSLKHYMDSTQVVRSIHDSIGNGTLTISYGTVDSVKFTANQKTNGRITIPAQVNADWNATEGPAKIENKPEITTVNDATLTIQKNGTTVGTFTANQATGQTIDIKVPTCDSLAECDLIISILARLDRLERANDSLAKEIEKLQPALTVSGPQKDTVCAGSTKSVTYTATFHNCSSSDYTLAWKVNGTDSSNVTGSKLILNVETAGQYVVVCIATRSDSTFVTDTVTTTVTVDNDVPSFTIAIEGLKVTLSDVVNTATIQWDTDSLPVPSSGTSVTHTYAVADTITITAISERGCTFTKDTILQPIKPEVTTVSIPTETIKATEAKVNGKLNSDGGIPTTRRGVLYSISNSTPRLGAAGVDSVINGAGMGDFTCDLRRLVPCSPYYVCAFAINEVDTAYGEVMTFSTPSFTCGDTLIDIDDNKYATLQLGSQCWMKQNLRTTHYADGTEIPAGDSTHYDGPRIFTPDSNLLDYGYLYNWAAAMHGSTSSSLNPSGVQGVCPDGWHLPSRAEWTQLFDFVASDPGNVCGDNPIHIVKSLSTTTGWDAHGLCSTCLEAIGDAYTTCCVCNELAANNRTGFSVFPSGTWEIYPHYYTNNTHAIFTSATQHYEQAYNYNVLAEEFQSQNSYVDHTSISKTIGLSVRCVLDTCPLDNTDYKPTVSAVTVTSTGGTKVNMAANVSSDGGATVSERGVCWGTASQPTTDSAHTASGTGIGDFSVNVTSLTPGTTYYVRAYATNSVGTAYGAEVTFFLHNPPTVTTTAVSDVTASTASTGGEVTSDGGATGAVVTARGVCWSTSENPTVSDNHTTDGSGTGSFTSHITGLNATTTYYVRAYATNAGGTSYGEQVTFTTPQTLPTVTTSAVSNIAVTTDATPVITAKCGGNVTDQGVAEVTARGVCWGTSSDPTIDSSHTDDGSGLDSFVSSLTGLSSGTTYYVRAYATNSAGTAYGNQVSFTLPVVDDKSCSEARTVTDHEGNVYATVKISYTKYSQTFTQCWMRENLRTTTSPKTGTYLVNTEGLPGGDFAKPSQYLGSKVAHWFNNDSATYAPKGYGLLYNWCAAMDTANPSNYVEVPTQNGGGNNSAFTFSFSDPHRGICPEGWHVPTYNDWLNLRENSPAWNYAVRLADGDDWMTWTGYTPGNLTSSERNALRFTAFPVGWFGYSYMVDEAIGSFEKSGERAYFWCSMQMGSDPKENARSVYLEYSNNRLIFSNSGDKKGCGLSVRCIKNQ